MKPPRLRLRTLLVLLVPLALVFWVVSAVRKERSAIRESACAGRLGWIALHLLNYRDTHGHFPSAALAMPGSAYPTSWRVRLDEFIREFSASPRSTTYDPQRAWSSARNLPVSREVPWWYSCPNNEPNPARFASYVALIDGGVSSFERADAIPRGSPEAAEAILVIEYPNSDIPWTEPRDLDVKDLGRLVQGADLTGLGVIFADGHKEQLSPSELRRRLGVSRRSGTGDSDSP